MGLTVPAPLPDNIYGWTQNKTNAAIRERVDLVNSITAQAGPERDLNKVTALGGRAADKTAELERLADELELLKASLPAGLRTIDPKTGETSYTRAIHPAQRGKVCLPGGAKDYRGFAEAVIAGLGGSGGIQAAFDGTSGGTAAPSWFADRVLDMPQRRLFLRDLIPTVRVPSDRVDYVRQTVNTHAAAAVAAGAVKPRSVYTIERVTAPITTIAHMSEVVPRQLLADFEETVRFLEGVLRIGVWLEEEDQILNGSGAGANLRGILNVVGIQTQALGGDPHFDAIFKALTKVRLQNFEPDGIVLHPNDWQQIRLTRTAAGEYIHGAPAEAGEERLFDKPVVASPLIAEGTALVGAFGEGAIVYDREQARVSFAETGLGDNAGEELFERNLIRFRGESRIGLGVAFPQAFCSITGV